MRIGFEHPRPLDLNLDGVPYRADMLVRGDLAEQAGHRVLRLDRARSLAVRVDDLPDLFLGRLVTLGDQQSTLQVVARRIDALSGELLALGLVQYALQSCG